MRSCCPRHGTHTRWQLVTNDGTGAPTLTDMGASFGIATGGVLTLFIAAPPNAGSLWVWVVGEVSGAVFEQEITADPPTTRSFCHPAVHEQRGRCSSGRLRLLGVVSGDGFLNRNSWTAFAPKGRGDLCHIAV